MTAAPPIPVLEVKASKRKELELAILSPEEELLGYLNPDYVQLDETNELGGLRSIDIEYPLLVEESDNLAPTLNGWNARKAITITGTGAAVTDGIIERTIYYENKMGYEFDHISIVDSDGETELDYRIVHKTNGVSALVAIQTDIPASGSTKTIYCLFGDRVTYNPSTDFYIYYDDFEDNKYTSRSSPYIDWTVRSGTGSITSANKITGSYSLQHIGNGTGTHDSVMTFANTSTTYTVNLTMKLQTQGAASYTPYAVIWLLRYKDVNNWVRIDTYWNSTAGKQQVRLIRMVSGGSTVVASYDWLGSKLPAGSTNRWTIKENAGRVEVYCDGTLMINTYHTYTGGTSYKGVGAILDSAIVVDSIIMHSTAITGSNSFSDNFDDNSLSATYWETVSGGGTSAIAETNGEIRVYADNTNRATLKSKTSYSGAYDLTFKAKTGTTAGMAWAVYFNWTGTVSGTYDYLYNGYILEYRPWDATKNIRLGKYVNGTATTLGTFNVTLDTNYHTYKVVISAGNVINIFYDDTYIIQAVDTAFTSGYLGFASRETPAGYNAYYNDVSIYPGITNWPTMATGGTERNTLTATGYSPSELLHPGNKVWREITSDGNSCLYVLLEGKKIDIEDNSIQITAEEAATELSMLPPVRFNTSTSTIPITTSFISTYFGELFDAGTSISGTVTEFAYNGTIGRMALIREIEKQTGYEFSFSYIYSNADNYITRKIDLEPKSGEIHTDKIEVGYNADNLILEIDEADVAIAAAPIGSPKDAEKASIDAFHQARKAFEDLVITPTTQIPLWVTKDESGNSVNGPTAYPPYAKTAGTNYVTAASTEGGAAYSEIRQKEKGATLYPRTVLFESSEENAYNMYWLCVGKIREKMYPQIKLDAKIVDINLLTNYVSTYYNVGDTVYLQLPGYREVVEARVIKTVKDPRQPGKDQITIGNYQIDFFADYLSAGGIGREPYSQI